MIVLHDKGRASGVQEGLKKKNLKGERQKEPDESSVHILSPHLVWAPCAQGAGKGRQLNSICLLTHKCCTHTAPCGKFCLGCSIYH